MGEVELPMILNVENTGAVELTQMSDRTKHIELQLSLRDGGARNNQGKVCEIRRKCCRHFHQEFMK